MIKKFKEGAKKIFICLLSAYIGYIIPQITINIQNWGEIFKVKENLQVNINHEIYTYFYIGILLLICYLNLAYIGYKRFLRKKINEVYKLVFYSIYVRMLFWGMNYQFNEINHSNIKVFSILIPNEGYKFYFFGIKLFFIEISHQISELQFFNKLEILFLTIFLLFINNIEEKDEDNLEIKTIYPSRLSNKLEFKRFLEKNSSNDLLLIDGRWGIGKTTLVDTVLNELKKEQINIYKNTIKIDAMSLLNKNTLLKEVFQNIDDILKRDGLNIDLWKDYKKIIYGLKENSAIKFEIPEKDFNSFKKDLLNIMKNYGENKICNNFFCNSFFCNSCRTCNKNGKKIYIIVDNLERIFLEEHLLEILGFFHEMSGLPNVEVVVLSDLERMTLPQGINKNYFDKIFTKKIYLDLVEIKEIISELNKEKNIINLGTENILAVSDLLEKIFDNKTLEKDIKKLMENISLEMEKGIYDHKKIKHRLEDFKEFVSLPRNIEMVYSRVLDMGVFQKPRLFVFYLLDFFLDEEEKRWLKRTPDIKNLNRNYINEKDDCLILINLIIEKLSSEKNGWEIYFYLKKIFANESVNIDSIDSIESFDKNQTKLMGNRKELKNIEDYIFLKGYTPQLNIYFESFFKNGGYKLIIDEIRPEIIEPLLKITNFNIKLFSYEKNVLVKSIMDYYRKDIVKYEKVLYILIGNSVNTSEFWNSTKTYDNYIEILSNTKEYEEILEIEKDNNDIIKIPLKDIMKRFFEIIEEEKLKEFGEEFSHNVLECKNLIENILSIEETIKKNERNIKNEFKFTNVFNESMKLYQEDKSILFNDMFRDQLVNLCRNNIEIYSTNVIQKILPKEMPKQLELLKTDGFKTIPEAIFRRFNYDEKDENIKKAENNLFEFLVKKFYLNILCIVYKWGLRSKDTPNYLFEEIEELKWVKNCFLDPQKRAILTNIFYEHFYVLEEDKEHPGNFIPNRKYENFKLRHKIEKTKEEVLEEVEKIFFKKEENIIIKWKDRPKSLIKYMNDNSDNLLYWNVGYLKKLLLEDIYTSTVYQNYIKNAVKNGEKAFEIYEKKGDIDSITEKEKSSVKEWMIFFKNARYSRYYFLSTEENRLIVFCN